jgi:hypothetical protein
MNPIGTNALYITNSTINEDIIGLKTPDETWTTEMAPRGYIECYVLASTNISSKLFWEQSIRRHNEDNTTPTGFTMKMRLQPIISRGVANGWNLLGPDVFGSPILKDGTIIGNAYTAIVDKNESKIKRIHTLYTLYNFQTKDCKTYSIQNTSEEEQNMKVYVRFTHHRTVDESPLIFGGNLQPNEWKQLNITRKSTSQVNLTMTPESNPSSIVSVNVEIFPTFYIHFVFDDLKQIVILDNYGSGEFPVEWDEKFNDRVFEYYIEQFGIFTLSLYTHANNISNIAILSKLKTNTPWSVWDINLDSQSINSPNYIIQKTVPVYDPNTRTTGDKYMSDRPFAYSHPIYIPDNILNVYHVLSEASIDIFLLSCTRGDTNSIWSLCISQDNNNVTSDTKIKHDIPSDQAMSRTNRDLVLYPTPIKNNNDAVALSVYHIIDTEIPELGRIDIEIPIPEPPTD